MLRLLRIAAAWAILFHDVCVPSWVTPLYAQNSDSISIGVTPSTNAPPAAVSDLLASANPVVEGQISLTWTAPQGNAGGIPILNQPVASYSIQYATFSAASVSGGAATWWNATASSNVLLQSPGATPKAPGQLESFALSSLVPGSTYYFGIKSASQSGITSPIDSESASPALQASAVATKFVTPTGLPPMRPNGLTASAGGGQFTLNWHPPQVDTNNQPVVIDHYVVEQYDLIGSRPINSALIPAGANVYTDTVGGLTYFYRVFAVAVGGAVSAASDYVDTSSQENRYAIAPDDNNTRVVMPMAVANELNSGANGYGEDLEIRLTRRQQDEVDVTLRSYHVGSFYARSGVEIPNFVFAQAGMQVQLGLGASLGAGRLTPEKVQALEQAQQAGAGSIAQIISVYWSNGGSFIRISDPVLTSNQAIAVNVRNVGTYQIRATQIGTQFRLTQGSPYPRVITPSDASQNNRVFWFFDNPSGDPVSGTIYDIRGAKVRELAINSLSLTSNSLVWDGHDGRGAIVPSGVYLYKIQAGKETQTGTVVVAR